MPIRTSSAAGQEIRYWRKQRALSQLDLALRLGMAPRQLSFIETGRARPRKETLLRLAEALEIPLRDRNRLLQLAGFPAHYAETPLAEAELAPVHTAIDHLLRAHEPYPAWCINRLWDVVLLNRTAERLFAGLVRPGVNLIEVMFRSATWREVVANWPELALHAQDYLRAQVRVTVTDARLVELTNLAEAVLAAEGLHHTDPGGAPIVNPRLRVDGLTLQTLAVVARFGAPDHVTLDELSMQLLFPADDETRAFFHRSRP